MIAFTAIVRLRLLELPLERDEGEYAYGGQLLQQGIPPYSQAYSVKFPGMYLAYAAIMAIFGQTAAAIRLGLLIVNAATIVLLYLLTERLFGSVAGLIASASYALFSLEPSLLGLYAHATHFVNLFVVAALLLLRCGTDTLVGAGTDRRVCATKFFAAGALLAVAILMKQQAAAFALFAILWTRFRRGGYLIAGGAIVGAIAAAWLWIAGVFPRFWLWTVRYAIEYAARGDGVSLLITNLKSIFHFAPVLWLMAAAGLFLVRRNWEFVIGYTVAAIVAIAPGLYFREHYFIVLLPPAAILIAIAARSMPRMIGAAAFAIAVVTALMRMWGTLFVLNTEQITRVIFPANPFVEAVEFGRYLETHTLPADRIAVLGSEPEVFFYAKRKSATGYIYMYPLMEKQPFVHRMQQEMIAEIERVRPKYLLRVEVPASWLRRRDSDMTIFSWEEAELQRGWVLEKAVKTSPVGVMLLYRRIARS